VNQTSHFLIFPLGDSAITIDLGNHVNKHLNFKAVAIYDWLQLHPFPGLKDIIISYSSVSLFYDPVIVKAGVPEARHGVFPFARKLLEQACRAADTGDAQPDHAAGKKRFFRVPVCYGGEYGPDLAAVSLEKDLSCGALIRLHSFRTYHIYMIGFLPGFPYMGTIDPRLEVARKQSPVPVTAGAVGIAGIQTGIYPMNSPGGWQIIGRTPTQLFNPESDPPVRFQPGDEVQFFPIPPEDYFLWEENERAFWPYPSKSLV
jgi:inhibitor of KinA